MKKLFVLCVVLVLLAALPSFEYHMPIVEAQNSNLTGEPFHCMVPVTTVTVITAVGGACGLPGTDQSLYVTDISFSTNSAGIAADSFPTLKYGLTTASVTVFWGHFLLSTGVINASYSPKTPIKIPAGNQIYFINSTAGSKVIVIDGVKGSGL